MENSPKGIVNLGNTCYINACIQIFSHISKFTDIIENTKISNLTCVECMLWKNIKEIVFKAPILPPILIIRKISNAGKPINNKKNEFICLLQNYINNVYLSNYE